MLRQCGGEHDDVVHVDSGEFTHVLECHVPCSLKCAGRIGQPEWHYKPLEGAPLGMEGCFGYVIRGHQYLVESRTEVHFREILRTLHFVNRDVHPRSGIDIIDRYRVETALVDAEA